MTLPAQDIVGRLRSEAGEIDNFGFNDGTTDLIREDADTISRLTADNEALRKDVDFFKEQFDDQVVSREEIEARADALAQEAERLRGALVQIAHTYTEDSHGGTKSLPAYEYQDIARAALANEEAGR